MWKFSICGPKRRDISTANNEGNLYFQKQAFYPSVTLKGVSVSYVNWEVN